MTPHAPSVQGPGRPASIWRHAELEHSDPLVGDASHGVCIVGRRVSGLCEALELSRRRHNVVVLDV